MQDVHAQTLVAVPWIDMQASVAMSADGMALVALADYNILYFSNDGGAQWGSVPNFDEDGVPWAGAAVSGSLQVAAMRGGSVFHNYNGGPLGWAASAMVNRLPLQQQWSSLALATTGPSKYTLAAAVVGGGIYISTLANFSSPPNQPSYTCGCEAVGEVATGVTGRQKWTGVAVYPTGAMAAVAAASPWGIYHSNDGQIWMPRTRWVCSAYQTLLFTAQPQVQTPHLVLSCPCSCCTLPRASCPHPRLCFLTCRICRGLRMQTYSNLQQSTLPIDFSKLTPISDTVIPRPDASSIANRTAAVVSRLSTSLRVELPSVHAQLCDRPA